MSVAKKLVCLECGQVNRVPDDRLAAGPKCGTCGAGLVAAKVREIDAATLARAARSDEVALLVDFWAPWCGPCRMMAPEFQKAAAELAPEVRLAKINTEDHPEASQRYGIRGIPTMILFQGGREVARQSGAMQAAGITGWVRGKVAAPA